MICLVHEIFVASHPHFYEVNRQEEERKQKAAELEAEKRRKAREEAAEKAKEKREREAKAARERLEKMERDAQVVFLTGNAAGSHVGHSYELAVYEPCTSHAYSDYHQRNMSQESRERREQERKEEEIKAKQEAIRKKKQVTHSLTPRMPRRVHHEH